MTMRLRSHLIAGLLSVTFLVTIPAFSQANPPDAPAAQSGAPPQSPSPSAAPAQLQPMPPPDPANFTAASPAKETVAAFLRASWGYDENRISQVQAIQPTQVQGISRVTVLVEEKGSQQTQPSVLSFLTLPDGKHLIANDEILPFGVRPFDNYREILERDAKGPSRGQANAPLQLVEFSDFQCPHCKEAQANMDKLATDFPKARIVFQNYPLARIHPQAVKAAAYGVCVTKLGGSSAFFQYASAVFDGQDGLASADGAALTLNSAVTKAGLDPAKVAACAATPQTSTQVDASVKLAQDLNINQTPTLVINGRQVPIGGVPYETLKQIVAYQAKLDGVGQ